MRERQKERQTGERGGDARDRECREREIERGKRVTDRERDKHPSLHM